MYTGLPPNASPLDQAEQSRRAAERYAVVASIKEWRASQRPRRGGARRHAVPGDPPRWERYQ